MLATMKSSVFDLQVNGITVRINRWLPDGAEVKGIFQVAHGMAEHGARYQRLARDLTADGWVVVAQDMRGHGGTANDGPASLDAPLGHLADHGGWNSAVEDIRTVALHAMSQHPHVPHVLLGHSMGSLLARDYATRYGKDLAGLVLSGTPGARGLIGKAGKALAASMVKSRGARTRATLLHKMSFGSFNQAFKPHRTEFDWLTRDTQVVDAYVEDPLCGFVCTNAFYVDLLGGLERVNNPKIVKETPKKLPVWVFSGSVDPAGGMRSVKALKQLLRGAGVKNVTVTTYPNGRHEMLNELNRDEVVTDLRNWLDSTIEA